MKIKKFLKCMVFIPAIINTSHADQHVLDITEKTHNIQQTMRENLSSGQTEKAKYILEQAAGNFHSVEIELGLIQTLMQAGEYRHALSAAAHTQAEHSDNSDAAVFYAWLLAIGGQEKPSRDLLEAALERQPNTDSLKILYQQVKEHHLISEKIPTTDAIQLKPFSEHIQQKVEYLINGILLGDSYHVITPRILNAHNDTLKIRNGSGLIVNAHIEKNFSDPELTLLKLNKPIQNTYPININILNHQGSPVYVIGYPSSNISTEWPQLKTDVLGIPSSGKVNYPLHIQYLAAGSGVYSSTGHLIGLVAQDDLGNRLVIPLNKAVEFINKQHIPGTTTHNKNTLSITAMKTMDEIYETALNNHVQILGLINK